LSESKYNTVETIYDGSWGAANLARIHGLQPPKTKPKDQAKKKRDGGKTPRASMLCEEHDVGMSLRRTFNEHPNHP